MEAIELGINNFVTIDNPKYHPKMKDIPMVVTGIKEVQSCTEGVFTYSIGLVYPNQKPNIYYESFAQFIEFIKPIELTDEWMDKFKGFQLHIASNHWECYYDNFRAKLRIRKEGDIWRARVKRNNSVTCMTEISFVHDLQNLYYSIAKKELQLKIEWSEKP